MINIKRMLHPKKGQNAENPTFLLLSLCSFFSWWLVAKPPVWCSCTIFWKLCGWRGTPDTWTHLAALNARQSSRSRQKETTQNYWKREDPKCSESYHPASWAVTFLRRKAFLQMVGWRTDQHKDILSIYQNQIGIAVPLAGPRAEREQKLQPDSLCSEYKREKMKEHVLNTSERGVSMPIMPMKWNFTQPNSIKQSKIKVHWLNSAFST